MLEVELVRDLEQRSVAMAPLAFGIVQGPGGIAYERLDLRCRRLDLELRADQAAHGERESEFPGFQPVLELGRHLDRRRYFAAIEGSRDIGLDRARHIALHEQ